MDFAFRPIDDRDQDSFFESWLGTYRRSPWAGVLPNNRYHLWMTEAIHQLLDRGAKALAVVSPEQPDHFLGYVVYETCRTGEPVVHYLFVRDLYRGDNAGEDHNLGQKLLEAAGIDWRQKFFYTFKTTYSRKFPAGVYCPEVARRKEA